LPERPISHRLGFYLQFLFNGYNVDCEYNKHLEGSKMIDGSLAIPDILVHRRRTDDDNLLAVEVKAKRNRKEAEMDRTKILEDYNQLEKYTRQTGVLKYRWGVFILILLEETIIEWFENGTPVQSLFVRGS
jgi:hypothetical protein